MKAVRNTIQAFVVLRDTNVFPMTQGEVVELIEEKNGYVSYFYPNAKKWSRFERRSKEFYRSVRRIS